MDYDTGVSVTVGWRTVRTRLDLGPYVPAGGTTLVLDRPKVYYFD